MKEGQGLLDFKRSVHAGEKPELPVEWVYNNGKLKKQKRLPGSAETTPFVITGLEEKAPDESSGSGAFVVDSDALSADLAASSAGSGELLAETAVLSVPEPVSSGEIERYHKLWEILEEHYANPLSSVVFSRTMLLPHQVQAALRVVESVRPRILIADEVGLGKTIETGLILKELVLKYNYEKVLVAVPAPLVYQWQNELKEKFNEDFAVITGPTLRRNPDILKQNERFIVSIDLLREPARWEQFISRDFDVVIFDEAHRLRKDGQKTTRAYQFAEKISERCKALLLLSATPFRGKLEEIYYLIKLIDPDILGPYHSFLNTFSEDTTGMLQRRLAPVVIRRRKVDVGGFTRRFARTVKLTLNPLERAFYDAVTEYVKKEYNRAVEAEQTIRAFVMIVFQKLLDSSNYALLCALEKRRERLEKIYYRINGVSTDHSLEIDPEELYESDSDEDYAELLDSERVFNPREVRQEIFSLTRLIELGRKIEEDSKINALAQTIKGVKKMGHEKIIIFTQFKNTMNYIAENLKEYGVTVFHGGLSARDKEDAIAEFFNSTEVLICTEAGGEGRNLQCASALINFDLPWSPLKVEQRIGRIHRFGQKSDVYVVNFATKDTIAEKILEILEKKIQLFEDAFGASDTLLGVTGDDSSFERSLRDLLREKKSKKDIEKEVESSMQLARENLKGLDNLLSTEVIDYNMQAFSQIVKKKENQLGRQEFLEKIISGQLIEENEDFTPDKAGVYSFSHHGEIHTGTFSAEYSQERSYLEYLTIGHPFVDSVMNRLFHKVETNRAYFCEASFEGAFLLVRAHIRLDRVYNRVYRVYFDRQSGEFSLNPPFEAKTLRAEPCRLSLAELQNHIEPLLAFVKERVDAEIERLQKKIAPGLDYWKNSIKSSHLNADTEFEEKLEIQMGKSKWYGEDKMVGAIKRTINQRKNEKERAKTRIARLDAGMKLRVEIDIRHLLIFGGAR